MKQRKEMINQTFKSSSLIRRVSFELRKQMILSPTLHLLVATLAGAFMIGPLITSLFILQTKFYSDNKLYFTDAEATDLKYSDFLKPILIGSSLQIFFITLSTARDSAFTGWLETSSIKVFMFGIETTWATSFST